MNYMQLRPIDTANGTGIRVSLFVSGCTHHCTGCFNDVAWDFDAGVTFTNDTLGEVMHLCDPDYIAGLSILGGEPLHPKNAETVALLCREFKNIHGNAKTIWIYTGYNFEEIEHLEAVKYADVIVDGAFEQDKYDARLRFKGSSNQRIIDVQSTLKTGVVVTLDV